MKYILTLLLFTAFSFVTFSKSQTETIVIKTTIYCDHCLKCTSCGANIRGSIKSSGGIKKVKIDPAENTITVTYDPLKSSPEKIKKSVTSVGFDADDLKASAEAIAKLDGCCKSR